jgi:hypothetical protein
MARVRTDTLDVEDLKHHESHCQSPLDETIARKVARAYLVLLHRHIRRNIGVPTIVETLLLVGPPERIGFDDGGVLDRVLAGGHCGFGQLMICGSG